MNRQACNDEEVEEEEEEDGEKVKGRELMWAIWQVTSYCYISHHCCCCYYYVSIFDHIRGEFWISVIERWRQKANLPLRLHDALDF